MGQPELIHLGDFIDSSVFADESPDFGQETMWIPGYTAFSKEQDDGLGSPLGLETSSLYSLDSAADDTTSLPMLERSASLSDSEDADSVHGHIAFSHSFAAALPLPAAHQCASAFITRTSTPEQVVSPGLMSLSEADLVASPAPISETGETGERPPRKARYTGTRNTKIPPIPLNAPTLPKSYLLPSVTSRKHVLEKRASDSKRRRTAATAYESVLDPGSVDEEVLSAIELKRRQNTIAARRSRNRKKEHVDELEGEIATLKAELAEWKQRCSELEGLVAGMDS